VRGGIQQPQIAHDQITTGDGSGKHEKVAGVQVHDHRRIMSEPTDNPCQTGVPNYRR
jgi:hypothetical protein